VCLLVFFFCVCATHPFLSPNPQEKTHRAGIMSLWHDLEGN
jgi:hypothetical protein